jgi:hypothetical protein
MPQKSSTDKYTFIKDGPKRRGVILSAPKQPGKPIPIDAVLTDLDKASGILGERYGKGYSVSAIRRKCLTVWSFGEHWTRNGSIIKIYLPAVYEWQTGASGDASAD